MHESNYTEAQVRRLQRPGVEVGVYEGNFLIPIARGQGVGCSREDPIPNQHGSHICSLRARKTEDSHRLGSSECSSDEWEVSPEGISHTPGEA